MAASPVFTSAALGRPFVLFPSPASLLTQLRDTPKLAAITPASRLEVRPAPEMVSSGIPELDALTGGWPRGCLSEICGPASSGRTSIVLATLARATQSGEACALVDASDALDPASAVAAGVEMGRLLWARCGKKYSPQNHRDTVKVSSGQLAVGSTEGSSLCKWSRVIPPSNLPSAHCSPPTEPQPELDRKPRRNFEQRLEQVLKITDLLLQSNGFGMIVLDLADIPVGSARRIPLASWFRFRRVVERTPTVLLVTEQQPIAGSCSSVLLQVSSSCCAGSGEVSKKKPSAFSTQHSASRGADLAPIDREILGDQRISSDRETGPSHAELLDQFEINAELLRSRLERKPSQAVVNFQTRAKWAG